MEYNSSNLGLTENIQGSRNNFIWERRRDLQALLTFSPYVVSSHFYLFYMYPKTLNGLKFLVVFKCNAWMKGSVLTTAYNSLGFAKMYTFYNSTELNDTNRSLIGILGDMLNSLRSRLNFTMTTKGMNVSDYGTKLPNGSFTGFVGMLQRGEFDIVAADTTITSQAKWKTQ